MKEGKVEYTKCLETVAETRSLAARLMNVSPSEIAFIKNTSEGILTAMHAIPWRPGDNAVVMKDAFPATTYPWLYLLPDVEKRWVPLHDPSNDPQGKNFVMRLFDCVDTHTRAISIDWVHYLSGKRLELEELGESCRTRGIFTIVDGIQGLGALRLDCHRTQCDFLCAGASKWLFGPQGTGILYVSRERFEELKPCNIGWLSADWSNFQDFTTPAPLKENALRLEEGTLNHIGVHGMRENLKIILSIGPERIERWVTRLLDRLLKGLVELDCEILTPLDSELRSGILSFRHPSIGSQELWNSLSNNDIACSLRNGWIRISPHLYNTGGEVDLILETLREQIGG